MTERGFSERGFGDGDLDRFAADLKAELVRPPDPDRERAHLAAMMAITPLPAPARQDVIVVGRGFLDRVRSFTLRLSAGTAGILAATTGLAYAGVDLPGTAAERAIESVIQVELPNQEPQRGAKSRSDEVHAVQSAMPKGGCEYGQAVSDAANGDHGNNDNDPCVKPTTEPTEAETPEPKPTKTPKAKPAKGPKEPNPSDANKAEAESRSGGHSSANEAPKGPKAPEPTPEPKENPSGAKKAESEGNSEGHSKANEAPRGPGEPKPEKTQPPKPQKTEEPTG